MLEKKAVTAIDIDDLIAKRWSPRAFDSNKPVSEEQILALCEAGRWAPSCFNDQPYVIMVWNKSTDIGSWEKAFDCLSKPNQEWVINAPVLMAAFASKKFRHDGSENRWGEYDTGATMENICLQAVSLGLISHQMGGFDAKKIKECFKVPEEFTPMSMTAIGYQAESSALSEKFKERENAERFRRELGTTFFVNDWDNKIIGTISEK
jgi:nitroreductase